MIVNDFTYNKGKREKQKAPSFEGAFLVNSLKVRNYALVE
jgi:hypothetical protein